MNPFSTLLALRYLNPLRAHVSVITLISLAGVSLGVMVLIVVLSVMDGFEDMIKSRFLGHAPHITSYRVAPWQENDPDGTPITLETQWRQHSQQLLELDSVTNTYPLIEDFVLVRTGSDVRTAFMRGLDTDNETAQSSFKALIVEGKVPEHTIDHEVAISSTYAAANHLHVSDTVEIIANRNLKELSPVIDQNNYTPLVEQHAATLDTIEQIATAEITSTTEKESMLYAKVKEVYALIDTMMQSEIRDSEITLLKDLRYAFGAEADMTNDTHNFYEIGRKQNILDQLKAIRTFNVYKSDSDAMSNIALPVDATIVGIFRADRYTFSPEMYVPLNLAQELSGSGANGEVRQIALTLKDPYHAKEVQSNEVTPASSSAWASQTWMEQHSEQFGMISSQKSMMTIALSFIVLIAVFSIGAVMFTVTIQKKREIGVMKALGATQWQITQVFTLQGVIVGIAGALIGWLLSLLVLNNLGRIQSAFTSLGFNPFPKSFLGSDTLPYIINPYQIIFITIGAFVLCTLAAYIPASMAARADAAKSLRNL